ncbi:MAG TPA: hypothetical protein VGH19_00215 [Verrucomicrobiae bacterium]
MRYFVPDIRLADEESRQSEKLGGVPWGLPAAKWPLCKDCGKPQSLLAQFEHHPLRLDLGRAGRVLFVFQCDHDPGACETWSAISGANACFVLEPEELLQSVTPLPPDSFEPMLEVRVARWIEKEDDIDPNLAGHFFEDKTYLKLPEEVVGKCTTGARLGGVPSWIQSPDEGPRAPWRFVGQLDSTYSFYQPPAKSQTATTKGIGWKVFGSVFGVTDKPASPVHEDEKHFEGRTHWAQGPNFGDGGIGYVFLKMTDGVPEGLFFWQCG